MESSPLKLETRLPHITSYDQMIQLLAPMRKSLLDHPIYQRVASHAALQGFMASHVFAVWDFMTLLKALQRRLTCTDLPWLPPTDIDNARLINEIVLCEETDEVLPGKFMSHFDLYLCAMEEVGADTAPIVSFILGLKQGNSVSKALLPLSIPESTKRFVQFTMYMAGQSTPEIAASFLLGREDVIPDMFRRFLHGAEGSQGLSWQAFRIYLERHVHLDGESHGPMGEKLLRKLCGRNPALLGAAYRAAQRSIRARIALWDGIIAERPLS
jgi:hypothetical protein